MRILALTHGDNVGPGVFEDAVRGRRARARRAKRRPRRRARRGADAVIVLGGAMHPDQEERHGWLAPELRLLERRARARDAAARRLPRLAADRPRSGRACLPGRRARGRLAPGRADRDAVPAIRSRQRCRSGSTPSSGTTTPTTSRRGPSSWPAARSARRRSGSGARGASSSIRRCGPSRSSRGWRRIRTTSPTRRRCGRRRASESTDWNELGRRLCSAFLQAV